MRPSAQSAAAGVASSSSLPPRLPTPPSCRQARGRGEVHAISISLERGAQQVASGSMLLASTVQGPSLVVGSSKRHNEAAFHIPAPQVARPRSTPYPHPRIHSPLAEAALHSLPLSRLLGLPLAAHLRFPADPAAGLRWGGGGVRGRGSE